MKYMHDLMAFPPSHSLLFQCNTYGGGGDVSAITCLQFFVYRTSFIPINICRGTLDVQKYVRHGDKLIFVHVY
jgi:hypothetical protein